jgi:hypothetical protein
MRMPTEQFWLTSEVAELVKRPLTAINGALRANRLPKPRMAKNGMLLWTNEDVENLKAAFATAKRGRKPKGVSQ